MDKNFLIKEFYRRTGYKPNIENPKTFNEKILWRKLNDRNPLFPIMANKDKSKTLAKEMFPEIKTNRTMYTFKTSDDIKIKIPSVLKMTCGSGRQWFFTCENDLKNLPQVKKKTSALLNIPYAEKKGEWAYSASDQYIILEEYESRPFIDVKYFVFAGEVKAIVIMEYKGKKIKSLTIYDNQHNREKVIMEPYPCKKAPFPIPAPDRDYGLYVASKLAGMIDFIRVDLYYLPETREWKFGEYTIYPTSGMAKYNPVDYDKELGEYWRLEL